ncbi:MAG: arginine--tRNA ligase [Candidatus Omnitrophica bacterium]|nr:arginine--tRNA ligase [Candidatus Omnitrophota bacterium]
MIVSAAVLESRLRDLIRQAVEEEGPGGIPPLEVPRIRSHGDLSTSVALQLASRKKVPPQSLAQTVLERLEKLLKASPLQTAIERIEVKPPGFINFFLAPSFLYTVLEEVLQHGSRYGRSSLGQGKKGMVEFVSANPTGPLSVAHGRQAAVGDALANLLAFAGYKVSREYYLNDEGTQIDLLGESILARARETLGLPGQFPENGYKGEYVKELGKVFAERLPIREMKHPHEEKYWLTEARKFGANRLTEVIFKELEGFGVRFDRWFPQSSLNRWGYLRRTLNLLKRRGYLYPSEGAWWLKSTPFGDDKDRVVVRSDGRLTYIAADIAYHRRKYQRGFRLLVNLWGPDHHGYIPRLKAAVAAIGFPPETLQIRIVQLCTLKRGSQTIPMSTREGQFITLTQVMEEVGRDAARFFFLLRKSDAQLEFDLELAKKHSPENPVYYIQYAHARISSILEHAKKEGVSPGSSGSGLDRFSVLKAPEELALLRLLREFPGVVELSARALEPFGVAAYLQELAEGFHRFYDTHRVVSDTAALTSARLGLVKAVQTVLGSGLRLLGISAPEKM